MALSDRFKDVKSKAQEAAASREDQLRGAVQKAQQVADEKTGGKYTEQIKKAGAKADGVMDKVVKGDGTETSKPTPAAGVADEAPKPAAAAPVPSQDAPGTTTPPPPAQFRE